MLSSAATATMPTRNGVETSTGAAGVKRVDRSAEAVKVSMSPVSQALRPARQSITSASVVCSKRSYH